MSESYDVVISSPFPQYDYSSRRMMELCGQMGLTFFFVNDVWILDFLRKLRDGDLAVRVLIDLTADQGNQDNPYTQLATEVKRQRGLVLDDPERSALAADKAGLHHLLLDNLIPVPETLVVTRDALENLQVDSELEAQIGTPFVVKPSRGGVGIVVDATSKRDILRSAAEAPHADAFLLQRRVTPRQLGQHFGWFRIYSILGQIIPCWWDQANLEYHLVTPGQVRYHKLSPLRRIVRDIARVTRMKKFSCAICLDEDGRFYAVDPVSPDPDMTPRSFFDNGVPDEVVRHIVWLLFVEAMKFVKRGQGFLDEDLTEAEVGWIDPRRQEQWPEPGPSENGVT